ncbi:MAG: hypothetical protein LBU44_09410 [Mediterranea sp.]|nr:hypothetical protein [Mediterranea sp.]
MEKSFPAAGNLFGKWKSHFRRPETASANGKVISGGRKPLRQMEKSFPAAGNRFGKWKNLTKASEWRFRKMANGKL